jgi:hypothetical protein
MPVVNFKMGEAEVGSQNTQVGILPIEITNSFMSQLMNLNYRFSTTLLHSYEIADFTKVQFYFSEIRNWLILYTEQGDIYTLKIIDVLTGTEKPAIVLPPRNTVLPRLQFREFSKAYITNFPQNQFVGNSMIFICGFDKLYYIDDAATLKTFVTSSTTKPNVEFPADIEMFQRRLVIINNTNFSTGTFQEPTPRSTDEISTQYVSFSTIDRLDDLVEPEDAPIGDTQTAFSILMYLEPREVLYTLRSVLDALYVVTSFGLRQIKASDRNNDAIAAVNVMQELQGYGRGLCVRAEYFNSGVTYPTTAGLRYKHASSTYQEGTIDMGEGAVPLAKPLDSEIVTIQHSKRNHELFIVLKNGVLKSIGEGQPMGNGMKNYPLRTYIENTNFRVQDVLALKGIYFLIMDKAGFLHLIKEDQNLVPLCDGVKKINLTSDVLESFQNSLTFKPTSQVALLQPRDIWVWHEATNAWYNMYQTEKDKAHYMAEFKDVAFTDYANKTINYIPTTDDIRPYLPLGYQEFTMLTLSDSIVEDSIEEDGGEIGTNPLPASWFKTGLRIQIPPTEGARIQIFAKKIPTEKAVEQGIYVFSGFFELSDLRGLGGNFGSYLKTGEKKTGTGPFKKYGLLTTYSFNLTASGTNYLKAGRGGCGAAASCSKANTLEMTTSSTQLEIPIERNLVWVYCTYPVNQSTTATPSTAQATLYFNGIEQKINYKIFKYSNMSRIQENIMDVITGSIPATTKPITIYMSSLFLHNHALNPLPYSILNIEAATKFFCTTNSGGSYFRPKIISHAANKFCLQDRSSALKNLVTGEILRLDNNLVATATTVNLATVVPAHPEEGGDGDGF